MTGYPGTPLAAKLGIEPGMTMRAVHAPRDYARLLAPLPDGRSLRAYREALDAATPVWVSWPKKSAGVATDISEDTIRALALKLVVRRGER